MSVRPMYPIYSRHVLPNGGWSDDNIVVVADSKELAIKLVKWYEQNEKEHPNDRFWFGSLNVVSNFEDFDDIMYNVDGD